MTDEPGVRRVSAERAEQLKAIAAARRSTVASLVDEMVAKAMQAGELPDTTPGVVIEADPATREITLRLDDLTLEPMAPGYALDLAGQLEHPERTMNVIGRNMVEIGRVGAAIEIKAMFAKREARRVFTPSVARDVARQLRAAAA